MVKCKGVGIGVHFRILLFLRFFDILVIPDWLESNGVTIITG